MKIKIEGQLSKKIAINFLIKIIATVLSLVISIVLARKLGAEGYGIYTYIITLIILLSIPTVMGLPNLVVRLVASYQVSHSWGEMRGIFQYAFIIVVTLSIIFALVAYILANFLVFDNLYSDVFVLALLLLPVLAITAISTAILRGLHLVVLSQIPENIIRPGLFVVLIIVLPLFLNEPISVFATMLLYVMASSVGLIYCLIALKKYLPKECSTSFPIFHIKSWFHSSLPLLLAGGMFYLNSRTDVLMLGIFKSASEIGLYQVAARGGSLIIFFSTVIASVIAPTISSLYVQKKLNKLQDLLTTSVWVTFLLTIPLVFILFQWGDMILEFAFGKEFGDSYNSLIILVLGYFFGVTMLGNCALVLNMTGFEKYVAIGVTSSAILNIVLNFLLIPKMGIEGAAWATTISLIFWNCLLVYFIFKTLSLDTSIFSILTNRWQYQQNLEKNS